VFTDILSFFIALIAVSFLHSVFGELVPKIISINYIEETALRIAPLLYYVSFIILPFTILYQQSANLFVRLFGVKASSRLYSRVYNEDELKLLISESQEFGEIEESEEVLLNRVFDFTETKVNEIFTPRFEIVAFEKKVPVDEIIEKARETGFSRFPIYENKLDEIIGFVHVKDILIGDYKSPDFNIMNILRNVLVIHEAMRLDLLLEKMQREKSQVAVVVDEYGSIEGFVTIEDILEEIVGPIDDEFDLDSDELIEKIGRNEFLVDGRLELDVFNQTFQSNLESEDAVTIAGYIIESLESVPEENASFQITNEKMEIIFEIRKMDGNRVENALVVINKI
jgi:CBS domain containing-hemolysin-like protein